MIFTLIVTASVALAWTVLSSLSDASSGWLPRDPTTLELSVMAVVTLAAYAWADRRRVVHRDPIVVSPDAGNRDFSEPAATLGEDAAEHAA